MLTICYSLLTWIQSRYRSEIDSWIQQELIHTDSPSKSLVFTRENDVRLNIHNVSSSSTPTLKRKLQSSSVTPTPTKTNFNHSNYYSYLSHSVGNYNNSSSSKLSGSSIIGTSRSETSTPLKTNHGNNQSVSCSNSQDSGLNSLKQISELCYNASGIKRQRLLWEEPGTSKILVLHPKQIVELHEWTAFIGTQIENYDENNEIYKQLNPMDHFYVLLETEPGLVRNKNLYRKFSQFGELIAWKSGSESFAIILHCKTLELVELMYVLRLGQLILEGGWRVFRLTTVQCEGSIGTLISKPDIHTSGLHDKRHSITPGDLRRFATGIYESSRSETPTAFGTPKTCLSKDTSKHDFTKISEESLNVIKAEVNDKVELPPELLNWYQRSPKKRSIATIHCTDRPSISRRKTSLSSLSQKSSSLASLLFCSKSMSIDETESSVTVQTPQRTIRQSCDSLVDTVAAEGTLPLPLSAIKTMSLSTSAVLSTRSGTGLPMQSSKTPIRIGKPPNILVLCEDSKMRSELASVLKQMLATDRYAIYDIRWDQLSVGGWSDQTALLVLSGRIPDPATTYTQILLQYLGDGGKLFAWSCETPPFGLGKDEAEELKSPVIYAGSQTTEIRLRARGWGVAGDINSTPSQYQRVLETNDSQGYSRPLTATVYAKAKANKETVIVQLDGGTLGGKAILSQVHFEDNMKDESCLALLSSILSQTLGLDCTRIKTPAYTIGYLLGDHIKINEFVNYFPSKIPQSDLTLEIVPRGEKGPKPTVQLLPIHYFECPKTFSTLDYFNNLRTREIGRVVVYTEVVTSLLNIFNGQQQFKHGFAAIAQQQTSGRGRGKNVWLSPIGSALFVVQLHTVLDVGIGRRLSLFQHLAALSIVMAIPQRKEIDLKVKWPNDIYLSNQKIGGILVESRIEGKLCIINIGIGVNVSNAYPTISLNSVLSKIHKDHTLSSESFIAKVFTELEQLIDKVGESERGVHSVLDLYMENWVHNTEDEVTVEVSEGKFTTCRVHGIDEFGFLRVLEVSSGHIFSVQPDGNSFDITNRLIAIKH